METKERLIRELAGCLAQLFDHEFQSIGGIYFVSSVEWTRNRSVIASIDGDDSIPRFSPDPLHHPRSCFRSGPIVSSEPPDKAHAHDREAFRLTRDWLEDRITNCIYRRTRSLSRMDFADDEECEELQSALDFANRLHDLLPRWFPESDPPESCRIFHHDLHEFNIISDEDRIAGLLDWEFVSVVPVWQACQLPRVLEGLDRRKPPERKQYPPYEIDSVDDDSLYWDDLFQHEQTQLRRSFLSEMERIRPEWVREYHDGAFRRDFVRAIASVERGFVPGWLSWIESLDKGEVMHRKTREEWLDWLDD
jgi:hypothetical protein